MSSASVKLGNFLFKNAFPLYNVMYPLFKNRQDKREIAIMKANIQTGDTILDIGANIGFYTRILSNLAGDKGKVYSFEPDIINYSRLEKNCRQLANVQFYNQAVSNETGVLKIYKSLMLNVDHRTYPIDEYESVEEISCVAIDALIPDGQAVDFIKIDIQGFEMSAFSGMKKTLAANPQVKIISEFWPFGLQKAGSSVQELLSFFWDAGFKVYLIQEKQFELIKPDDIDRFSVMEESIYMNIFVTRNEI